MAGWDELDPRDVPDPPCWRQPHERSEDTPQRLDPALHLWMANPHLPAIERLKAARAAAGWHGHRGGEYQHWHLCTTAMLLDLFTNAPLGIAEMTLAQETARVCADETILVRHSVAGEMTHDREWNSSLTRLRTALTARSDLAPEILAMWTTFSTPDWTWYSSRCRYTDETRGRVNDLCGHCRRTHLPKYTDRSFALCLPENAALPRGYARSDEAAEFARRRHLREDTLTSQEYAQLEGRLRAGQLDNDSHDLARNPALPDSLQRCFMRSYDNASRQARYEDGAVHTRPHQSAADRTYYALAGNPVLLPDLQEQLAADPAYAVRTGLARNFSLLPHLQRQLLADSAIGVVRSLIANPALTHEAQEIMLVRYPRERETLAKNPALAAHVRELLVRLDTPDIFMALADNYCLNPQTRNVLAADQRPHVAQRLRNTMRQLSRTLEEIGKNDRNGHVEKTLAYLAFREPVRAATLIPHWKGSFGDLIEAVLRRTRPSG
jgi:hypothetical protein